MCARRRRTSSPMRQQTSSPAAPILATPVLQGLSIACSCRFFQGDVHFAMRAGNRLSESVKWKFNVFAAGWTGSFDVPRLHQRDGRLAMRAGDFLSQVFRGKFDVSIAQGAGHFQKFKHPGPAVRQHGPAFFSQPNPSQRGATAKQQVKRNELHDESRCSA